MRQKSYKFNMILNAIKGGMSIFFPLIAFPYVSQVLGVENLGRYNFANSIISYLELLAGLGISTYAIREGARIRTEKREFRRFASEMLSINIWATAFSYLVFGVLLLCVPKFRDYRTLLIILSLQIVFKTIGVEWLFSIYEDYAYITVSSIVFQAVSLVLLFIFVKDKDDTGVYALITVISAVGSNLLNFIHGRKYCKISIIIDPDWKKHIKSILIMFSMSAAIVIYVSSDITILGFLCDDFTVGIYTVSTKVYTIVKTVLSSVLIVSVPRLSSLLGADNKGAFVETSNDIYKTLITIVAPSITCIIIMQKEIVLVLATEEFISATSSLFLLCIALFFCMGAWFWGQCVLVPLKKETIVFKITIFSALVNIILNLILIPFWKEKAAAITTIIAEGVSFFMCGIEGKKLVCLIGIWKHYIKVIIGCAFVALVGFSVHALDCSVLLNICVIIPSSIIVYFVIEILMKNESILEIVQSLNKKIKRD